MKNPIEISKKGYNRILKIDDVLYKLDQISSQQNESISHLSEQLNNQLNNQLSDTRNSLQNQIHDLENLIRGLAKANELYFFTSYQKPNEDPLATRQRFFLNMPKAYGPLRTYQLGCLKLFKNFIELCEKHHLTYFLEGGTLLGAVRHHGFIPWDDDVDVCMFRDEIWQLREILKNNPDFRITIKYDIYVNCRQIRFCTTNPDNPCFIDLFIYDYSNQTDLDWQREWYDRKKSIEQKILSADPKITDAWRQQGGIVDDDLPLGHQIRALFEKYYDPIIAKQQATKDNYKSIVFGLDNLYNSFDRYFLKSDGFPLLKLKFENLEVYAPKNYQERLKLQYGDIYELPLELPYQHITNLTKSNLSAIEEFLD